MKDTIEPDKDGLLVEEREISSDDNMFLANRDNPDWPRAVKTEIPEKLKKLYALRKKNPLPPNLMYSARQRKGVNYGK